MNLERTQEAQRDFDAKIVAVAAEVDPFEDDTPIVASCDLENPESCESCQ